MTWLLRLGVIAAAVAVVVLGMYAWRGSRAAADAYGPATWNVPVAGLGGADGDRGGERRAERDGLVEIVPDDGDLTLVALPDDVAVRLPDGLRHELAVLYGAGRVPRQVLEQLREGGERRRPSGDGPFGDGDGPFGGRGRREGVRRGDGLRLDATSGFGPIVLPIAVLCGIAGAWEVARRRRHARARTT